MDSSAPRLATCWRAFVPTCTDKTLPPAPLTTARGAHHRLGVRRDRLEVVGKQVILGRRAWHRVGNEPGMHIPGIDVASYKDSCMSNICRIRIALQRYF
jgi:hypothetical protein